MRNEQPLARHSRYPALTSKNHQGSVTDLTNSGGGAVKSYWYDAYGNILLETGPALHRGFTYTGRERHARSGLYYYRARFYDPILGRFIIRDPIGWYLEGINLYAYVGNNPVDYVDPLGLFGNLKLDPGVGGTLSPMVIPHGVDVGDNLARIKKHGLFGFPFWLNNVRPGGDWDYKRYNPDWQNFGNYNYGYTGAHFFSDEILFRVGGAVGYFQFREGEGRPWGNPPYGDQLRDYLYIQDGIIDYRIEHRR